MKADDELLLHHMASKKQHAHRNSGVPMGTRIILLAETVCFCAAVRAYRAVAASFLESR